MPAFTPATERTPTREWLGPTELIIVLIIVMLLFGAAPKLPKLARSLGESSKEFRKGVSEERRRRRRFADRCSSGS